MLDSIEIPEFHFSAKLYLISYRSQGYIVKGYLAIPKGEGPFSLLIYCRGGIRNVGMTKLRWIDHFVSKGFMIFAPFYRGNRGGQGREDFGGDDRYDVLEAMDWLMTHPLVQPNQIHLFGFSRGAIPALFTSMTIPEIRSVSIWGGVTDLALTYEERIDLRRMLKRVVGGTPGKASQEYKRRSPIHYAEHLLCPLLIIHGGLDEQVGIEHAYRLVNALKLVQKPYDFWIYERQGHHFTVDQQGHAMDRMLQWMKNLEK